MSELTVTQQLERARQAAAAGDWRNATALSIAVLKADPRQAGAHVLLGLAAAEGGNADMAQRALRTALRLDPQLVEARVQLARILANSGRYADAAAEAARACADLSGDARLLDLLATVYSRIGNQRQALALYLRALESAGDDVGILSNAAAVMIFLGQQDEAIALLQRVLVLQPGHYRSHWLLARARRAQDREQLQQIERLTTSVTPTRPATATAYLHYAAGKICEDLSAWNEAWQHYYAGASAQRDQLDYDAAREWALFDALEQQFSGDWYRGTSESSARLPVQTRQEEIPVFIVGLPRAGSSLLEKILGSHPQVQALGELVQWPLAVKQQSGTRSPALYEAAVVNGIARVGAANLGEQYLQSIAHMRDQRKVFTDKLPNNFLYLPLIARALPAAKMVHVRRNPMDAGLAIYKQLFADAYPFSYDLQELGDYYVRYHQLMTRWQALLGDRLYILDYDELVADPEMQIAALLNWLDLPFDEACLQFHRSSDATATPSASQVREPIYRRASGRWKNFASELMPYRQKLEVAGIPVDDEA